MYFQRIDRLKLLFLTYLFSSASALAQTYTNPITSFWCADPGAFYDSSTEKFYMSCTGGRFRIKSSNNLVNWSQTNGYLLPSPPASWAYPGRNWAPHLTKIGNTYLGYFVQNNSKGNGAIAVSWSNNINSDFIMKNAPVAEQDPLGAIDPSFFKEPSTGRAYLLYKVDGNSRYQNTQIKIQELRLDGKTLAPNSSSIVLKTGGSRMSNLIEGQDLIKRGQYYYLFYSYGNYTSSYRMYVARADNLFGPYTNDRLILSGASNGQFYAPGHGTVVRALGKDYFVYHAYDRADSQTATIGRKAMLDRIYWNNGWPLISNGYPSETPQPLPLLPGQINANEFKVTISQFSDLFDILYLRQASDYLYAPEDSHITFEDRQGNILLRVQNHGYITDIPQAANNCSSALVSTIITSSLL